MSGYKNGKVEIFYGDNPPANLNILWQKRIVTGGVESSELMQYNNNLSVWESLKNKTIQDQIDAISGLDGTNYLMVYGVGTPTENAAELKAAYDAAKLMLPTVNNRITVIIAPGTYDFGATAFVVNTPYINIVSLTGNSDVIISSTEGNLNPVFTYGIKVTADNILIKDINCKKNTFYIADNLDDLICEYCIGGVSSFGYENIVSGTFNHCIGGANSFGTNGTVLGTFNHCIGGSYSFGGSYGGTASGTFNNCIGGSESFGGLGTALGEFNNCVGGEDSFGGQGTLTGKLINCKITTGAFPIPTEGGRIYNCIDGNGYLINNPLPVFADNAAAASLATGALYRTVTGVQMIKY